MDTVTVPGTTVRYKTTASGLDILMDVWPPSLSYLQNLNSSASEPIASPTFIYFHGGGLAAGNRHNFTPRWLFERLTNLGYIFVSADYRLLPTSTGHDVLEDIIDLWHFVTDSNLVFGLAAGEKAAADAQQTTRQFSVKPDSIAVGGTSAGGLCAYLAAIHCKSPKPQALLNIYAMGGEILTSYHLANKTEKFNFGPEMLKPEEHPELLYPINVTLFPETSDSILLPDTPNARIGAAWLHLQIGTWLDYYFGEHEPSLSVILRGITGFEKSVNPNSGTTRVEDEEVRQRAIRDIPEKHWPLIPQLQVSEHWPAVFLLHGTADTAVPPLESKALYGLLQQAGVPAEIRLVEGQEHNFDFDFEAEQKWGHYFASAIEFVHRHTVGEI
ncbi:Alpha/Beta hydrolase protein [Coprinopsis sp. MPI-PUGE-AT-0042]|nr:Alpha/Beta hydrolase protein [Coprinopsis sp. MPI-PUGE-AT-0042]